MQYALCRLEAEGERVRNGQAGRAGAIIMKLIIIIVIITINMIMEPAASAGPPLASVCL